MTPPNSAGADRLAAAALIAQFLLILTTFVVLSGAIDWPASLDDPASVALPRLITQAGPVMIGYGSYLIAALLLVPATAGLNGRLGLSGPVAGLALWRWPPCRRSPRPSASVAGCSPCPGWPRPMLLRERTNLPSR